MQSADHNSDQARGGQQPSLGGWGQEARWQLVTPTRRGGCWEAGRYPPQERCPAKAGRYGRRGGIGLGLLPVAALALLVTSQATAASKPAGLGRAPEQAVPRQTLPASLQSLFNEGVLAQKSGQLDVAEKAFLRVLQQGGNAAYVYNNLGIVYQMRGDHLRAIAQFRKAILIQPDYAAPRILAGASLLALGKIPDATRELERAVRLEPREPLARLQLAKAYERAGHQPATVDQFRALRELSPKEPEYAYQLGSAYLKLAAWCYEQIKRIDPGSARVYQTLAENYRLQGRLAPARRAFQRAAQTDPKLPGIHLALAEIYSEQGKAAEARKEVDQELAIVPESAMALALKQKLETAAPKPH